MKTIIITFFMISNLFCQEYIFKCFDGKNKRPIESFFVELKNKHEHYFDSTRSSGSLTFHNLTAGEYKIHINTPNFSYSPLFDFISFSSSDSLKEISYFLGVREDSQYTLNYIKSDSSIVNGLKFIYKLLYGGPYDPVIAKIKIINISSEPLFFPYLSTYGYRYCSSLHVISVYDSSDEILEFRGGLTTASINSNAGQTLLPDSSYSYSVGLTNYMTSYYSFFNRGKYFIDFCLEKTSIFPLYALLMLDSTAYEKTKQEYYEKFSIYQGNLIFPPKQWSGEVYLSHEYIR